MHLANIDFYSGAGVSFTTSRLEALDNISKTDIINGSFMAGMAYSIEVSDNIQIGLEANIYYITELEYYILKTGFKTRFDLFSW